MKHLIILLVTSVVGISNICYAYPTAEQAGKLTEKHIANRNKEIQREIKNQINNCINFGIKLETYECHFVIFDSEKEILKKEIENLKKKGYIAYTEIWKGNTILFIMWDKG
jgi:hypothetical protein